MQSKRMGDRHFLRLQKGEEMVATLSRYLKEHNIGSGAISGIGAAEDVTLAYFNRDSKQYEDHHFPDVYEILSLTGNVSLKDNQPFAHLHIALGDRECRSVGGHLMRGIVAVTCELIIDAASEPIERGPDEETGLQLWQLQ